MPLGNDRVQISRAAALNVSGLLLLHGHYFFSWVSVRAFSLYWMFHCLICFPSRGSVIP